MTKRQRELLAFISDYEWVHGYPPSLQEMADEMKTVKSVIHRLLKRLEEQGRIRRLYNRVRAIEVIVNPHLPVDLSHAKVDDLVREANRRGMVVGFKQVSNSKVTFTEIEL